MVEGRGLAFDAKVRGWLSDGRKYATEFLFAYLAWNEKGNLKVFWVSHTLLNRERFYDGSFRLHTSIEMWKVLWWFSAFHFLVVWFLLSFVFLLLCWRIGGYVIFCGLRSVFFQRVGWCAVLGMFSRWFFGCFCGVKIELWWSLWRFLRFWSGVGEGCALWRDRKWYLWFGLFDIPKCRFVDHQYAKQRCLLVSHVVMRNRKTMV